MPVFGLEYADGTKAEVKIAGANVAALNMWLRPIVTLERVTSCYARQEPIIARTHVISIVDQLR